MSNKNYQLARYKYILFIFLSVALSSNSSAALITYSFSGNLLQQTSLFNPGDAFSGSYTFESTAATSPVSDPSMDISSNAMRSTLPGTGWNLTVFSSAVGDFTIFGTDGGLTIGDNASIGDRYNATFYGYNYSGLPLGLTLNFFQIALSDNYAAGADMLTNSNLDVFPDLSKTNSSYGRFFILDDDPQFCTQCSTVVTSFTRAAEPISEPATLALLLLGFLSVGLRTKNQTFNFRKI